jgi:hypothetical protein
LAVAWTNPKTWSFGEILTSADMNTYVRDNTEELRANAADASFLTSGTLNKARLPSGTIVDVKSAIFTGTQTNSTAAGGSFAITGLSISHAVASASNLLIISGFVGAAGESLGFGAVGIAVFDGTDFIATGASPGSRTAVTAGAATTGTADVNVVASNPAFTIVHAPGAGSKTYSLHAFNAQTSTQTVSINRQPNDNNAANRVRTVSSLVIQEVQA